MEKKLYRPQEGRMICGVCAGLGEYFGIDPTVIRVGAVVLCCLGGSGVLAYIIAAVIIPEKPKYIESE